MMPEKSISTFTISCSTSSNSSVLTVKFLSGLALLWRIQWTLGVRLSHSTYPSTSNGSWCLVWIRWILLDCIIWYSADCRFIYDLMHMFHRMSYAILIDVQWYVSCPTALLCLCLQPFAFCIKDGSSHGFLFDMDLAIKSCIIWVCRAMYIWMKFLKRVLKPCILALIPHLHNFYLSVLRRQLVLMYSVAWFGIFDQFRLGNTSCDIIIPYMDMIQPQGIVGGVWDNKNIGYHCNCAWDILPYFPLKEFKYCHEK